LKKSTRFIGQSHQPKIAIFYSPVSKENLPMPWVHYPDSYGAIFAFSETEEGKKYICECNIPSVRTYLEFYSQDKANGLNPKPYSIFPPSFSEIYPDPKDVDIESFDFAPKLCHRCNFKTPEFRYCHEMYGSNFKQFYGWYITLNQFKFGVDKICRRVIRDFCPEELLNLLDVYYYLNDEIKKLIIPHPSYEGIEDFEKRMELIRKYNNDVWENPNRPLISELQKKCFKQLRIIEKYIEDITRTEFGFRKVGEGWVAETQLFKIVKQLFSNSTVIRHYRPEILNHLELDIYIVEKNIGIEYQGQQHFHPIKAWGGQKSFEELKQRDSLKKNLCKENETKLIEFDYTEPIIESYIKDKLIEFL